MRAEALMPVMVQTLSQTEASLPAASYYRSRLFVSGFTNNPLVAAASPIFSLLDRLSVSTTLPPVEQLRNNLAHELKAFDSRLLDQDSRAEMLRLARFMLCATMDEIVGKNYLRANNAAPDFQAFSETPDPQKTPQEIFFELIPIFREQAQDYLALLEFAYFCLISGLEGPYHNQPNGRQQLDELLDELYCCILQHRTHRPVPSMPPPEPPPLRRSGWWHKKNIFWAGLFLGLTIIGLGHYHALDRKVKNISLQQLASKGVLQP